MVLNLISLYLFGAVLVTSFLTTYVIARGRTNYLKAFSALSFCGSLYLFGYLLEINSTNMQQMIFWNQIQNLGLPFIPALWLIVALLYTKRIQFLQRRTLALLLFVPVMTFFLRLTNSFHHIYYSEFELRQFAEFSLLYMGKGPWYYVQAIYILVCVTIITYVFYREYTKSIQSDQSWFRVLLYSSILPIMGLILIASNFLGLSIDYAALLLPISYVLVMFAIVKYDFLEIQTLARDTMFENSSEAMVLMDKESRVIDYNKAAQDLFSSLSISLQRCALENILGSQQELMDILKSPNSCDFQCMQDGEKRYFEIGSNNILNAYGKNIGNLKSFRDITETKVVQETLKVLATVDALSGLYNREHFMELAQKEFNRCKRYNQVFSVVMMDIDHFKAINDTKGHAAGDAVIQEIGRLITVHFRKTDISGRLGGEEFALVLTNTSTENARIVAEQFRKAVGDTKVVYDHSDICLTISIGIAPYFSEAETLEEILKCADEAMYESKAKGRNCTTLKDSHD